MVTGENNQRDAFLLSSIITIADYERHSVNIQEIEVRARNASVQAIFVFDTQNEEAEKFRNLAYRQGEKVVIALSSGRNPGTSRNIGLSLATGDWIHFCDCDDLPDYAELMSQLKRRKRELADKTAIVYPFTLVSPKQEKYISASKAKVIRYPGIWRWVFKATDIGKCSFAESRMGEDQAFIINFLQNGKNIHFDRSGPPIYRHFTNQENSLTSNFDADQLLISIDFSLFAIRGEKVRKYAWCKIAMIFKMLVTLILRGNGKIKLKGLRRLITLSYLSIICISKKLSN